MTELDKFNHVDLLFPGKYLKAADLRGHDVEVEIEHIDPRHELQGAKGEKEKKPVITMTGKDKKWVLNKTNAKSIAHIHGNEVKKWIGQKVTIYPTTVNAGGEVHECIRVRVK